MFLKMTKIEMIGPKSDLESVLAYIHRLGILDIEDLSHRFDADARIRHMQLGDDARASKDRLEAALVKINSFITALESPKTAAKPAKEKREAEDLDDIELLTQADRIIAEIERSAQQLTSEKRDLELEQANLAKYMAMLSKMAPLIKDIVSLEGFDNIMLLVDRKNIEVIEVIDEELARITRDQFQLVTAEIDGDTSGVVIIFNRNFAKQVREFLWGRHVNEVRLPKELAELPYEQAVVRMNKRLGEIPKLLGQLNAKLKTLSNQHGYKLLFLSRAMTDRLDELHIINHFGATDYTFVIHGWLPKRRLAQVKVDLREKYGTKLIVEELAVSPKEMEEAPIKYQNGWGIKAFEPIMTLFGTPRYGTVDPTPFLAFFFPLFFGIILGDMGYALVVLALAFWLKAKFKDIPAVQSMSIIFVLCGISSFVFGFIFGEFFGDTLHRTHFIREKILMGVTFPVDRQKDALMAVLVLAIALGAAHILLGLVLGAVNAARVGSRKHMVEKLGMLLTLVGLLTLAAGFTDAALPLKTPGTTMLIVAVPMLLYGGGVMALLEILGMIGNVLSYARIMALGTVSVVIASLANQAASSFDGNIILGVTVALLIHSVNIAIHIFTPSIHALRLNFVEFFGKFYEAGGREYRPFRRGGI